MDYSLKRVHASSLTSLQSLDFAGHSCQSDHDRQVRILSFKYSWLHPLHSLQRKRYR